MIYNEEKLRKELFKYNITGLTELKYSKSSLFYTFESPPNDFTHIFGKFILNINRTLSLFSDIVNYQKTDDIKYNLICEMLIIQIITSLEVYLTDIFKSLSYIRILNSFNIKKLNDFLNELRINILFEDTIPDDLKKVRLYWILPEILDFQRKEKLKKAFLLFDIELHYIDERIWERIFSKEQTGYIKLRNGIVHKGAEHSLFKIEPINLEKIIQSLCDICKFIFLIDSEIIKKNPKIPYSKGKDPKSLSWIHGSLTMNRK